jgi:hypothetical protein
LSTEREAYLGVLNSTNQGVRKLGIKGEQLPTGSAEMAFLIPRGIFGNDLGTFAKELGFLNRLITHVSEVLTAHAEPVELGQISSSDPTITLATGLAAMTFIGNAVNKFLDAWKKVEEIREIRQRLNKLGMRKNLTELTDEITSTVNEVVEESTTEILAHAQVEDGRKNELGGVIRKDLLRLFGQVEQGLVVEIRVSPPQKADADADPNLETLKVLSQTLQFPAMKNQPILLSSGDLLDDEDYGVITRRHKKTTTTKNIETKKKTSSKTTEEQAEEQ